MTGEGLLPRGEFPLEAPRGVCGAAGREFVDGQAKRPGVIRMGRAFAAVVGDRLQLRAALT